MGTQSRNITFGIALGEGRSPAAILAERKVVTEGVPTAKSLTELGRRLGVRMPVALAVNRVVNEGGSVDEALAALLGQPTGAELGDLMDSKAKLTPP
jgi:glycerol-3-phosphate dehydrogenase (NAD(P)+)